MSSASANKVAVVTGASSGIGAAILKLFAKNGITAVGLARRDEKIKEFAQNSEGRIVAKKCDLSKPEEIDKVFDKIETEFGQIDILVNSAGIFRPTSILDGPVSDLKNVLDINVLALCLCTRKAVQVMKTTNIPGHIININSVTGHSVPRIPGVYLGIYPGSKHAVTAITQSLRNEISMKKLNIKVTSISPGTVLTEIVVNTHDELNRDRNDLKNMSMLMPEDVAAAVYFTVTTSNVTEINEIILKAKETQSQEN